MSFPALLRRSSFATYDPLITRIYTSPSSSSGDFGFKYSLPLKKGPKYIKVHSLDAGKAVGTDWTSGEQDARWVETWGNGRVKWTSAPDNHNVSIPKFSTRPVDVGSELSGKPTSSTSSSSSSSTSESGAGGNGKVEGLWTEDLESMTPKEFERYLNFIRSHRKEFLERKLASLSPTSATRLRNAEDSTLVHLSMAGHSGMLDGADTSSLLTSRSLSTPGSKRIVPRPHPTYGLHYSPGPTIPVIERTAGLTTRTSVSNEGYTSPLYTFKGRVVDRMERDSRSLYNTRFSGGNTAGDLVVSAGGQTGFAHQPTSLFEDENKYLHITDYTRSNPTQGEGKFVVTKAEIKTPPKILGLKDSDANRRWIIDYDRASLRVSSARKPKSLDTMDLDISFGIAPTNVEEVGSKGWVNEVPTKKLTRGDALAVPMAGSPRADRQGKEGTARVLADIRAREMNKQDGNRMLQRVFSKMKDNREGGQLGEKRDIQPRSFRAVARSSERLGGRPGRNVAGRSNSDDRPAAPPTPSRFPTPGSTRRGGS